MTWRICEDLRPHQSPHCSLRRSALNLACAHFLRDVTVGPGRHFASTEAAPGCGHLPVTTLWPAAPIWTSSADLEAGSTTAEQPGLPLDPAGFQRAALGADRAAASPCRAHRRPACHRAALTSLVVTVAAVAGLTMPTAHADNTRLNNSVVANVYTIQHQAGCTNDINPNPQLRLAAQWHTNDLLSNHALDGDIGSDGSTAQDRANAAGFRGKVAETTAINPALAINNLEILHQWYDNPAYLGIMQDCANTAIGVWSENSFDRSILVAVYGQPA